LLGFSEKRNQFSEKKEVGPGATDLSQAGPNPVACPGWLNRSGMPPSDPDPTARLSSSLRVSACSRGRRSSLGFAAKRRLPRGCGGRRRLDRRRGWSVGDARPGEVHAEGVVFTGLSTTSRRAPVMDGEVDGYGIPGPEAERVRSGRWQQAREPERGSREMARLTATSTLVGDDLPP
jgi:hypothetical protein